MANRREDLYGKAAAAFIERYGTKVRRGPFAGMRYLNEPSINVLVTKLLGIYEQELYDVIENEIIPARYKRIVNVGCGDGYYAVGLALRMRKARIIAYDIKASARRKCREMARLNGTIDRLELEPFCDTGTLQDKVKRSKERRTLLFCDAEGYELELLDPDLVPSLSHCDMLVELHDFIHSGIKRAILSRFEQTHAVTLLKSAPRDPENYPELQGLSLQERSLCVSERRPAGMEWVFLKSTAEKD
ncbi:MAG: trmB2 [Paenibacillus sp.]|jgi:hypothetical protein|nr:trmB2 [Paenibacillus sp.]